MTKRRYGRQTLLLVMLWVFVTIGATGLRVLRRCGRQALLVMLWVFATIGAIGLLVLVGWGGLADTSDAIYLCA